MKSDGKVNRYFCALAFVLLAPSLGFSQQDKQAAKVHRIGWLSPASPSPPFDALRQGLRDAGYVEGRNLVIETRYAEGRLERLPELAADLLRLKVDVLVSGSGVSVLALKRATTTVPIVFSSVGDPVAAGILTSATRPEGNITGVLLGPGGTAYSGKWVELLKEAVASISHVAVLANSANYGTAESVRVIQGAARTLNVKLDVLDAGNPEDLDKALATIGANGAQGIIVTADPFFTSNRGKIAQFAASKHLPSVSFTKLLADSGGLMAYGGNLEDSHRRAARHVDKILKGAKPTDLPIEPMPLELVVNLKTARALGLTIPQSLLQRADKVIE